MREDTSVLLEYDIDFNWLNDSVAELGGYNLNFVYKRKRFHVNTANITTEKSKLLGGFGLQVYGETIYFIESNILFGEILDVPQNLRKSVQIVLGCTSCEFALSWCSETELDLNGWDLSDAKTIAYTLSCSS